MSVLCPLETWSLVCSFLKDTFYFSPCITSFHFIWALFFLFLNKNGIGIGAWREWVIHPCLYLVRYFKGVVLGLGASLELWKGMSLTVIQTPKPSEDCLGRHNPSCLWGPKLIYCQTYNFFSSKTVPFIDAVKELSATFSFAQFWKHQFSEYFPWVYDTGRSQTSGKFHMPQAGQPQHDFSSKGILPF